MPQPEIYLLACERESADPANVGYLGDLGINLKLVRKLDMMTIKVLSQDQAIEDLSAVLGVGL